MTVLGLMFCWYVLAHCAEQAIAAKGGWDTAEWVIAGFIPAGVLAWLLV